jgi:hypothetical protein
MNRRKKYPILGLLALIVAIWVASSFAGEIEVNITSVMLINSPDQGTIHFLAKPELGLPDTTLMIDRAILNATIFPQTQDTVTFISIRLQPITIDWDPANVSWDNPWTEPGGDYDEINYGEFLVTGVGNQPIEMDLTSLLTRWADGALPYYGFLIKISISSWSNFAMVRNGDEPYATLSIDYTVY